MQYGAGSAGQFCPDDAALRYLCENSIGPEQWLEVLEDVHQPYRLLPEAQQSADIHPESGCFVAFADFVPVRLWQNMQLT